MNKHTEQEDDVLMTQLREHLSDDLTPDIKRRLQQARHSAIDSLEAHTQPSLLRQTWLTPAIGTAAAFALGLGLFWQSENTNLSSFSSENLDISELVNLSDIENQDYDLLNASLDEELDFNFYVWLDQQPEFME